MAREFHDINEPGHSFAKKKEEPKENKRDIDIQDIEPVEKKKEEPEVRIISAEWKPGPGGFQYLEQCFLEVQTEFLPGKEDTERLRIRGKLFGIFNGQEFDLSQEIEGFIDRKTGVARLEIKKLWFIDDHYSEWLEDSQTPCTYKIKGIFHSLGENEIDSPELSMPANSHVTLRITLDIDPEDPEAQDDKIRLFSTDDSQSYEKILTVKDDKKTGNDTLELEFPDINSALSYTLEVDHGGEGHVYYMFEDKKVKELGNG
ncbi:MAG: hypothetical protein GF401_04150 [Chitinivibrionales bacterium]|nr:hypothetical protein [Chitinivibrionales bacterium]